MVVGDERIGRRRDVTDPDQVFLDAVSAAYVRAVQAGSDPGVLVGLGRELYEWLDGATGQLTAALERADAPVVSRFRDHARPVTCSGRCCGPPGELLARPGEGLLAEDGLARFSVVRHLGLRQHGY